jgi:hypothetical protein
MVVLNNLYGTTHNYYSSIPSDSTIINKLSNNKPLYSVWSYSGGRHAMVIYGMNIIGGYISIMDPEYGFASAVSNGTTYKYTSLYSGVSLSLSGYGA